MENSLFLAVVLRKGGETSKEFLARVHRIAEDHEEATDDAEVAEEEVEVENEAITECLDNDNTEKSPFNVRARLAPSVSGSACAASAMS